MVRGVYEIMISTRFGKKDLKLLRETLANLHGRVLDIGCGNLLDRIGFSPGDEYIGADVTKSKYTALLADIHNLPFKNESFDSCICNAVLEHIREPEIALNECYRVLERGGVLWVSVPFLQHIHSDYDFRRFTGQGLAYGVEKAGFHVDRLHGSYGVVDNIEYLLYSAVGWRVAKDKDYKSIGSVVYILILGILFLYSKLLGVLFNSQQKRDIHHATSFDIIAHKE
ncbi:MAG: class I SAM-dependent methyltransferase [Halobacteriota archaeon]